MTIINQLNTDYLLTDRDHSVLKKKIMQYGHTLTLLNRHFDAGERKPKDAAKLFSVPDFVGDACKAIASRIRGAVAGVQFDDFHKVQILSKLSLVGAS